MTVKIELLKRKKSDFISFYFIRQGRYALACVGVSLSRIRGVARAKEGTSPFWRRSF